MYSQNCLERLTTIQIEALNMLIFEDMRTVAYKLDISIYTILDWHTQPEFIEAIDVYQKIIRDCLRRQILFEANRLFHTYQDQRDDLTPNQKVQFLATLAEVISDTASLQEEDDKEETPIDPVTQIDAIIAGIMSEPEETDYKDQDPIEQVEEDDCEKPEYHSGSTAGGNDGGKCF